MTDSVADELIQSGFRRWLNIEEQKEALAEDSKELMAELKAQGLDPKVARAAFREERIARDARKANAADEHAALVDLYRAALARDAREGN